MCAAEVCGGSGAARLQGGPSPTRGAVALSDREVETIRQLVGYLTRIREGLEGVFFYTARDYDEEIKGRRIALETAMELGKFHISAYLERRGLKPDKVEAKEKRYGFEHAFHGKIRFYIWIGDTVHVFEETDERRGRYVGEYATKELEEYGI